MSFVSFYAIDANKEIWIMIIWISLSTDLISIGGLVLVSMDHLDLNNSKDIECKEVNYRNLKIGKLKRLKTRISWLLPRNWNPATRLPGSACCGG